MEEALRRRFVFYGALKSRFTAQFSAANNSADDDDRVDEQKERTKEKAAAAEGGLCLSLLPILSICPAAAHPPSSVPQVFSTKAPSFLLLRPFFRSIWPLAISTLTKTFFPAKKREERRERERTRGETPTWVWKKEKRKMESLKPATCVKTFRHSFVPSRPFSPSLPTLLSRVLTPLREVRHRMRDREGRGRERERDH